MKTERVTFLAAPEFKIRLQHRAAERGISVGELVRQQFEATEEQVALAVLADELKRAVGQARKALQEANRNVGETLAYFEARRGKREAA
jgi:hypothetical protein